MSADPGMMAQLLASRLGSGSQGGYVGGQSQGQPQVAAQGQGLSDIAQKLMLMAALRKQPQQPGQPMPPQPNTVGGVNALPQAMNQQPIPGGINS